MTINIRFVEKEDCEDLWEWRNELTTRKNSFNTDVISLEDHKTWFAKTYKNPYRNIFIGLHNQEKIGMVRFDQEPKNKEVEINIVIAPRARGKGHGTTLIKKSCEAFFNNYDYDYIIAKIKYENAASIKAFEKAGFITVREEKEGIVTHLHKEKK